MVEHAIDCTVCGAELSYLGRTEQMVCALCTDAIRSAVRCAQGHFVCDGCHSGTAKDAIERVCRTTVSRDPIEIALLAMRHPRVKMHGPEHHFLVPAALIAAWYNARGEPERKAVQVAEARGRSDPVAGGFCGIQGACGAGIGVGTFVSIVTGATPLSARERGLANQATARALTAIAGAAGPRCCKRDSWLALLAGARFARQELGSHLSAHGPTCEFEGLNRECLSDGCPFFRRRPGIVLVRAGSHQRIPMAKNAPAFGPAIAARYAALAGAKTSLSCGAALDLANLRPGETVVDLGCGRGRDVIRAAELVGAAGQAIGVDASEAMLAAARAGRPAGLDCVTFVASDLARVDLPDFIADVVISNCAINHARDKGAVYREIHRLLRRGGRLVVSDVVAERELPAAVRVDPVAWAECYGGAIPEADYLEAIRGSGFVDVTVLARTEPYRKGSVEVRSITVRAGRAMDTNRGEGNP